MTSHDRPRNLKWLCIGALALVLTVGGCSSLDAKYNKKSTGIVKSVAKQEAPPKPVYSGFKDVLVPGELTEDKRHTSVIQQGENATGFISYYGRVQENSVIHFFSVKMPEDGWHPVTAQTSPFSTIMIFSKGGRCCTIQIKEKGFTTDVQIGVAPAITQE